MFCVSRSPVKGEVKRGSVKTRDENVVKISSARPECPSCNSKKTMAFHYWDQKKEWVFACRDTNAFGKSACNRKWIESDRNNICKTCQLPRDIETRGTETGHFCKKCNKFLMV